MDWIASALSLLAKIPTARKDWFAPILGVIANLYWIWYEYQIEQWGLMPLSAFYVALWLWVMPKWWRER